MQWVVTRPLWCRPDYLALNTALSSRNVRRQLATSPWWCTRLYTKLRYMSEDVTAEFNNSGSPFCCFNATSNAKNRHGHHWSNPRSDDFQIHNRVHRHIYQIRGIVPLKHGVCNFSWKCAMETHMPVLYTARYLNRSGFTVYESNTYSTRLSIWH